MGLMITKENAEELITCLIYYLYDFLKKNLKDYDEEIDNLEEYLHECMGGTSLFGTLGLMKKGPDIGHGTRAFVRYLLNEETMFEGTKNTENIERNHSPMNVVNDQGERERIIRDSIEGKRNEKERFERERAAIDLPTVLVAVQVALDKAKSIKDWWSSRDYFDQAKRPFLNLLRYYPTDEIKQKFFEVLRAEEAVFLGSGKG